MVKLYRACSVIDNYHGRDGVTFLWFVVNRDKPVAPYEELIANYQELEQHQDQEQGTLAYLEGYVNELLTEEEVEELKAYLESRHNTELKLEEVEIPVQDSNLCPLGAMPAGGGQDFYMLSREEGYSLSVPIWAYYDLRQCPDTIIQEPDRSELGKRTVKYLDYIIGADGSERWEAGYTQVAYEGWAVRILMDKELSMEKASLILEQLSDPQEIRYLFSGKGGDALEDELPF